MKLIIISVINSSIFFNYDFNQFNAHRYKTVFNACLNVFAVEKSISHFENLFQVPKQKITFRELMLLKWLTCGKFIIVTIQMYRLSYR